MVLVKTRVTTPSRPRTPPGSVESAWPRRFSAGLATTAAYGVRESAARERVVVKRTWLAVTTGLSLLVALPWVVTAGDTVGLVPVALLVLALVGAAACWFLVGVGERSDLFITMGSWILALGLLGMTVLIFIVFAAVVALAGALMVGIALLARSPIVSRRLVGGLLLVGPVGAAVVLAVAGVGSETAFMAATWCVAVSLGLATAASSRLQNPPDEPCRLGRSE